MSGTRQRRAQKRAQQATADAGAHRKLVRVLLVEDDSSLKEVVCALLHHAGYLATCVTSVEGARAALRNESFDVVILDWMLVGETSEELLPSLAALDPSPPTVLYSADTRARAIASSWLIPFLGKPFDFDALLKVIERAVSERAKPRDRS